MFKRRKPEDDAKPADKASTAASPIFPARPETSGQGSTMPATGSSPSQPSPQQKDPAPMGRTPFPTPPSPNTPSSNQPGQAPRPIAPGAAAAPGAPRHTAPERRTLVVGRGISVQGTVQDAERLVVEGTVEASMIQATELAVSPGGVFRGGIEVQDAELAGTIDGTLTVRGSLTVRATGRLIGTVKCRRLKVEDGGQITGKLEMITEDAPRVPAAEPSEAAES